MNDRPTHWGAEALWQQIEPLLPGLSVEVVAHADSTNTQLLQRYRGPHSGRTDEVAVPGRRTTDGKPCLLVAEHQSAGRGRMGRSWQSASGASLTFSLALMLVPQEWGGLSLAIGVALAEALEPVSPAGTAQVTVKWPNDLWYDDRKLGGVLIETIAVGSHRVAVIGVGLNVLPLQVPALTHGYACLQELDVELDAPAALHRVALPLARALREFEREGFAAFHARFAQRDVLRGRHVRSGAIEGIAQGVTPEGGLQVETDSGVQIITSNEVSVRLGSWGPTTQSGLTC
jgi:BirA family transcriptional regulator, biotin operon repressor / biotin---[acetyl-CoA-carboxylase] ligase